VPSEGRLPRDTLVVEGSVAAMGPEFEDSGVGDLPGKRGTAGRPGRDPHDERQPVRGTRIAAPPRDQGLHSVCIRDIERITR
jgi:hypothetical protein